MCDLLASRVPERYFRPTIHHTVSLIFSRGCAVVYRWPRMFANPGKSSDETLAACQADVASLLALDLVCHYPIVTPFERIADARGTS